MTSQNLSPLSASIDVAVSPNPAQNYLRISTDDLQASIPIQIFNSNGQCVKEFLLQDYSKTFDISEFKSGTYVIKSTAGNQTTSQIIVVR